jgi:hypothetical protein
MKRVSSEKGFQRVPPAQAIVIAIPALSFVLLAGCARSPAQLEAEHQQAKTHFLELVKAGLNNADKDDVARTFARCFREGDEASQYADILATGEKEHHEARTAKDPAGKGYHIEAETRYEWRMPLPFNPNHPDSTLRALIVHTVGDPPCIRFPEIADSVD